MNPIIAAIVLGSVVFISGCTTPAQVDYSEFTQCLSDSGIQEYGAYWCPNCARVKLTLGDAHQNVNYVECDPKCVGSPLPDFCVGHESHTDECLEKGISKYPSWVKGNDILYSGTDLEIVSQVTGCQLPE